MARFEVVEQLSIYQFDRTLLNTLEEAVTLTGKISAAGGRCYVLEHKDGAIKQLPLVNAGGTIVTHDRGDFNDHSGLVEHSTAERAYNKKGRL